MKSLDGKTVLITGATGSFGTQFISTVLERYDVKAIRAFSRDELKQSVLRARLEDRRVRFLLGDVRDLERLRLATRGVDLIVHAAALKQVPALEFDPLEAIKTNVVGTSNVITAAIENGVKLTVGLSTDKAVNPANLYGCTKLCAERVMAQAGVYGGRFGMVRYGNVIGSRGSVVPIFQEQSKSGVITITDRRMTRFLLTLEQAVEFVLTSIPMIRDGETFVPKVFSASIVEIAEAVAPGCEQLITGIRPGEKLHETLLTVDEARNARDLEDRFVILPHRHEPVESPGEPLPDGFAYTSLENDEWLDVEGIREMVATGTPVPRNPERKF